MTEWRLEGLYMKNCNCDPGCPCDFNADTTHHECEGMAAMIVEQPQPYQIQVRIPNGFEYDLAEVAQATVLTGTGDIKFNWTGAHSSLARVARHPGN